MSSANFYRYGFICQGLLILLKEGYSTAWGFNSETKTCNEFKMDAEATATHLRRSKTVRKSVLVEDSDSDSI